MNTYTEYIWILKCTKRHIGFFKGDKIIQSFSETPFTMCSWWRQSVRVPHCGLPAAHHQSELRRQRPGGALQHAGPGAERHLHRPGHLPCGHEGVDRRLQEQRVNGTRALSFFYLLHVVSIHWFVYPNLLNMVQKRGQLAPSPPVLCFLFFREELLIFSIWVMQGDRVEEAESASEGRCLGWEYLHLSFLLSNCISVLTSLPLQYIFCQLPVGSL